MSEIIGKKRTSIKKFFKNNLPGFLYITPVLIGIVLFTIVPMVSSLYYSFFDFKIYDKIPTNFGFQNYIKLFTSERSAFFNSLGVTFLYSLIGIPLSLVLSFALAYFLNQKMKGVKFFRMIYYIPVIIPAVVSGLLWADITDYEIGFFNLFFTKLGLPRYGFYSDPSTVFPTLIFMGLFSIGGGMVLWIAQLKSIPDTMYEAAQLEGAGFISKMFKITIPMCTPMIFYNLTMGIIGSLQTFTGVFMLINSLNAKQLDFIVVRIYNTAFSGLDMGLACALSWMLFLIITSLTGIIFKTNKWVYYGENM